MTPDDANGRQTDVAASLQEMDRKLRELQRELAVAASPQPAVVPAATSAPAPAPPPPDPAGQPPLWWLQKQEAERVTPPAAAFDPVELSDQVERLIGLRDRLVEKIRAVMTEADRGLRELGIDPGAPHVHGAGTGLAPPELSFAQPSVHDVVAPHTTPDPGDQLLDGKAVVEAGPFSDIGVLTQFERVLAGVPGVADVYVRGFEGDRALIDVTLTQPVRLGGELVARLGAGARPLEATADRLVLAMEGGP